MHYLLNWRPTRQPQPVNGSALADQNGVLIDSTGCKWQQFQFPRRNFAGLRFNLTWKRNTLLCIIQRRETRGTIFPIPACSPEEPPPTIASPGHRNDRTAEATQGQQGREANRAIVRRRREDGRREGRGSLPGVRRNTAASATSSSAV